MELSTILAMDHPWLNSRDNCLHGTVPSEQMARNQQLTQLDRLYLFSFAVSCTHQPPGAQNRHPRSRLLSALGMAAGTGAGMWLFASLRRSRPGVAKWLFRLALLVIGAAIVRRWRAVVPTSLPPPACCPTHSAKTSGHPFIQLLHWLIRRKQYPAPIISGFRSQDWEENDGVCNTLSSVAPWISAPDESGRGVTAAPVMQLEKALGVERRGLMCTCPLDDNSLEAAKNEDGWPQLNVPTGLLKKGFFYTHKVRGDHFFGTAFDDTTRTIALYKTLFAALRSLQV